jgi:hypothetical protein
MGLCSIGPPVPPDTPLESSGHEQRTDPVEGASIVFGTRCGRVLLAFCGLLFAVANARGGQDVRSESEFPDKLTLYSIERVPDGENPQQAELFHDYVIRGQLEVSDPTKLRTIFKALMGGLAQGKKGDIAFCFDPHHAIRTVRHGKVVDYLICFHCSIVHKFRPGAAGYQMLPISKRPQATFDRALQRAGVHLPAK